MASEIKSGSTVKPRPLPLAIERIYFEPAVNLYDRGRAILARFPDAERISVRSHWKYSWPSWQ